MKSEDDSTTAGESGYSSHEEVVDRILIDELVSLYAVGLDTRDWKGWRGLFTSDIIFDMSSVHGRAAPVELRSADEVADGVATLFAGFDSTQHLIGNCRFVQIDDIRVRVLATMQARHWKDDGFYAIYGYYDDEFLRTSAGWRISKVQLKVVGTEGDRTLMEEALRLRESPGHDSGNQ